MNEAMKYNGVLIAVSDMENSRRFYSDVLGLKVVEDFGANVTLEGGGRHLPANARHLEDVYSERPGRIAKSCRGTLF